MLWLLGTCLVTIYHDHLPKKPHAGRYASVLASMETKKLVADVVKNAEIELKSLGFRKKKGIYVCRLGAETFGWLGLNTAAHRGDGRVGINPVVGVRHEHLEQLVSDLVAEDQLSVAPTVSISLGYVMPENRYLEWLFEPAPFDYISECNAMVQAVETYGTPFMRANATLPALLQDLEDLRFTSKEMAAYRSPVAHFLSGKADIARAYLNKQLEELGERGDLAAQQYKYKGFASRLLDRLSIRAAGVLAENGVHGNYASSRAVAGERTQANYVLSTCGSAVGGEGTSAVDQSAFFTRSEQHNAPAE